MDEAAHIALETTARWLTVNALPAVVTFVCFGNEARLVHEAAREKLLSSS